MVGKMKEQIRNQVSFAYRLSYEDIDETTREHAKDVILDSIGCVVQGLGDRVPEQSEEMIFDYAIAMVNTELYEGNRFAVGHPAIHIIPAMLYVCRTREISYRKFITTFVAAYEVAARWGQSVAFPNYVLGHGTVMTAAAALAYGLLTEETEETLYQAILIANSLPCVSVWQSVYDGSPMHDLYAGMAAVIGVKAVHLAKKGVFSTEKIVEEVYGHIFGAKLRPENLDKNLGSEYLLNKNYYKIHTGCRFIHPFADVLKRYVDAGLTPDEVESIEVLTYKKAAQLVLESVPNEIAAKFSMSTSLAILLYAGELSPQSVTRYVQNDAVKETAKHISLREDEVYNSYLPDKRGGKLIIHKKDGTTVSEEVFHAGGDFDGPVPYGRNDVIRKFRHNVSSAWDEAKQTEWIKRLLEKNIEFTVCI